MNADKDRTLPAPLNQNQLVRLDRRGRQVDAAQSILVWTLSSFASAGEMTVTSPSRLP
jgi:hypothetical protein